MQTVLQVLFSCPRLVQLCGLSVQPQPQPLHVALVLLTRGREGGREGEESGEGRERGEGGKREEGGREEGGGRGKEEGGGRVREGRKMMYCSLFVAAE